MLAHRPLSQRSRYPPMTLRTKSAVVPRWESPALLFRRALLLAAVLLSCFFIFRSSDSLRFLPQFSSSSSSSSAFPYIFPSAIIDYSPVVEEYTLEKVLKDASMEDKTVILTTLNEAWAAENSTIDLFLESFRIGNGTLKLLNHLVIIALDQKAFSRCLELHNHCFSLASEGDDFHQEAYFMTPDYLKMMWRRIDFLCSVLELGYDFVFTDADVMWFRDPFPRFHLDADFQIACDHFFGSAYNIHNKPNGGFTYVKANNRTIDFYKFWYSSRETYPGYHDQDVLNIIKFDPFVFNLGLKMRFLDTAYFGGLCEPSKDLNQVCTMHANCCLGLESKLHDLRIMLQDWRQFVSLPPSWKRSPFITWRVPENCSIESLRHYGSPVNK
ncbi:Nucleotide-diphospho-sugar transferase [Parasponia andersonii]|uniref:Nucleotide-diphospho-sugar transferase n=1 Tax=Parasponia andersonii TaxID=3476 RepID=A0A2P5E0X4_PARAD|nr:Nucleotide-diphospho-sugar transferase [Parasponia andersonii]